MMRPRHRPLCIAILLVGCIPAFGFTGNWNPGFWNSIQLGLLFTMPIFLISALLVSGCVAVYMAKRREKEGAEKRLGRTFGKTFVYCIPVYLFTLFVLAVIDLFV
jgi:hypothetical protein